MRILHVSHEISGPSKWDISSSTYSHSWMEWTNRWQRRSLNVSWLYSWRIERAQPYGPAPSCSDRSNNCCIYWENTTHISASFPTPQWIQRNLLCVSKNTLTDVSGCFNAQSAASISGAKLENDYKRCWWGWVAILSDRRKCTLLSTSIKVITFICFGKADVRQWTHLMKSFVVHILFFNRNSLHGGLPESKICSCLSLKFYRIFKIIISYYPFKLTFLGQS